MTFARVSVVSMRTAAAMLCVATFARLSFAFDDGPPLPDAAETPSRVAEKPSPRDLDAKRMEVASLEYQVQLLREEFASAVDRNALREVTLEEAQADVDTAVSFVDLAKLVLREYAEGTYPQELLAAQGQIKLAESELTKAQDRYNQVKRFEYKLDLQKADFVLKEAQVKLSVLEGYTKPRALKELGIKVAQAETDLAAKQRVLKRASEREAARARNAPEIPSKSQISNLLDESVTFSEMIVKRLRTVKELQTKTGLDPAAAEKVEAEIKALQKEVAALSSRSESSLTKAIEVAEQIHEARALLRDKEAQLEKSRAELAELESRPRGDSTRVSGAKPGKRPKP